VTINLTRITPTSTPQTSKEMKENRDRLKLDKKMEPPKMAKRLKEARKPPPLLLKKINQL
jgi:hypothetical protein